MLESKHLHEGRDHHRKDDERHNEYNNETA